MDNKKADNIVLEYKQKINEVDNRLDEEKKKLKKLNQIQNDIDSLSKNINKCIDLLSKSMKGPGINNMFSNMSDSNKLMHIKASSAIENEFQETNKKIYNLYGEKDKIIKENRNKYNQEEIKKG